VYVFARAPRRFGAREATAEDFHPLHEHVAAINTDTYWKTFRGPAEGAPVRDRARSETMATRS
jgi:hypothetical protein